MRNEGVVDGNNEEWVNNNKMLILEFDELSMNKISRKLKDLERADKLFISTFHATVFATFHHLALLVIIYCEEVRFAYIHNAIIYIRVTHAFQ